jgi:hypothetical protein
MANASPHNAQDGGNPGGMVRNNSLLPAGQLSLESCEVPMQQTASNFRNWRVASRQFLLCLGLLALNWR